MRRILKTVLLLAVLCLAGCKSEGPHIEISVDKTEVAADGETVSVTITANCPWYCQVTKDQYLYEHWQGEGTRSTTVTIKENTTFDDQTYLFTVKGPEGCENSTCIVTQKESIGMKVQNIGMISEEGGAFDIPVNTNDNNITVDTPDWITFTSSRALTGYTYNFTAEPNKTGAVRKGTVSFKGSATNGAVEVTQDSYAPTGITIKNDLSFTTASSFESEFAMEPEYADPSKLTFSTSDNCKASVENGKLIAGLTGYGAYSISILSNDKVIADIKGERIPANPFHDKETEAYLGESNFIIDYIYYSKDYILQSSDPSVISIGSDGKPHAVGLGTATVSVTHPKADCYGKMTVHVFPFLLEARIGWFGQTAGNNYDVRFTARMEGPSDMFFDGFMVTDNEGHVLLMNKGTVNFYPFGETGKILTLMTGTVTVSQDGHQNFLEAMKGYRIMIQVTIGGKLRQRTVYINTHHAEPY